MQCIIINFKTYYNTLHFTKNYAIFSEGTAVFQGGDDLILHRMGVVLMKNQFSFNDLMQFGLFLIALLTFIYMISH